MTYGVVSFEWTMVLRLSEFQSDSSINFQIRTQKVKENRGVCRGKKLTGVENEPGDFVFVRRSSERQRW